MQASKLGTFFLGVVITGSLFGMGLSSSVKAQVMSNQSTTVCRGDNNSGCTTTTTSTDGSDGNSTPTTAAADGTPTPRGTVTVSPRTANTNDVRATIQRRIQRHYNYVR
jgi:hypothetical protein